MFYLPLMYFVVAWCATQSLCLVLGLRRKKHQSNQRRSALVIEAGERGWQSIEFQELYQSAVEYMGQGRVKRLVINRSTSYAKQVRMFIRCNPHVTHYLYDPRSGRDELRANYLTAFTDSLSVAIILAIYRISPIVYLTDASCRLWRCQAAIVTCISGMVITFMPRRKVLQMFPHSRVVGPSLMPFSLQRLQCLREQKSLISSKNGVKHLVVFTGSLYEPRTSFLNQFKEALGEHADVRGRKAGGARISDSEYWSRLLSALVVITTADQITKHGFDMSDTMQLVYRYTEALAAGSCLLAPAVPGVEKYFTPGKHFVPFDSIDAAISQARHLLAHPTRAHMIAAAGHAKAQHLIKSHAFWLPTDLL